MTIHSMFHSTFLLVTLSNQNPQPQQIALFGSLSSLNVQVIKRTLLQKLNFAVEESKVLQDKLGKIYDF